MKIYTKTGDDGETGLFGGARVSKASDRVDTYGTVDEHGLHFVAFSADPSRFERMLRRMFGQDDDGLHDRLTDFSRPVASAAWFVPALDALGDVLG